MNPLVFAVTGFVAGLLVGMNPVLISTFTSYISSMIGRKTSNGRYTLAGFIFILYFVLFVVFFATALGTFVVYLSKDYQLSFALVVAMFSIGSGILLIRRYFWHEPIVVPPKEVTSALNDRATKKQGIGNLIMLTIVVVYSTLPTVGAAIAIMASIGVLIGPNSLVWSIPFAIGLITPIYGILALLSNGTRVSAIVQWKENTKSTMRLYSGLTIIAIAWLLLYIIAGGEVII